jgi:histidinol phosphatase-like enzyme
MGKEVLLESIGTGVTSIMFCVHLPKRACKGRQSFL